MRILSKICSVLICIMLFITLVGCSNNKSQLDYVREGEKHFFYRLTLGEQYRGFTLVYVYIKGEENPYFDSSDGFLVLGNKYYVTGYDYMPGDVLTLRIPKWIERDNDQSNEAPTVERIYLEDIVKIEIMTADGYFVKDLLFQDLIS